MTDDPLIRGLVPMIFVSDVNRSAAFYRSLGFEIGHHVPPGAERNEPKRVIEDGCLPR